MNIKVSSIANQAQQLEKVKNGTYPMSYEAKQATIRRIENELRTNIQDTARAMGEQRFNFELKFGLEHGFRAGH
jgi:hypothetical protein